MNGVHDMGGMDGFGAVPIETNEPVFHAEWERRMCAIALGLARQFRNTDEFRHAIERIPASVYLDSSYYGRWLNAMMTLLVEKNIVSRDELVAAGAEPVAPSQPAGDFHGKSAAVRRRGARYREGDRVIARNLNPSGHTRLPRYVRGKRGIIHRDWGSYVFADSHAHHGGDREQHVYSVVFTARELWGDDAPARDSLRIDLWEDYLEADRTIETSARKASRAIKRAVARRRARAKVRKNR